ncbi:acyltransferase family protein [Lichenicola sp.]|uniref:acyltransferase family protein n=1 Tax=Lichenicola sp. TaxID=2804529 RepID=UPI003B006979
MASPVRALRIPAPQGCREAIDPRVAVSPPKHLAALDGLRGVAVTFVIASHSFPMVHDLPWTVKRFSNLGFYGVQLFFVVSCVTLANSWRRSEAAGVPSLRGFALRRVFRIAPAYFLAALGYAWLLHPAAIDPTRLLTFVTFTDGWTPAQMPTVPGSWIGVPGGWSIKAEFAFYMLFPCLIVTCRGVTRALAALVVSLPLAWIANSVGLALFEPAYGTTATLQFLYYWLPNQLPVFLCGLVAYEVVAMCSSGGRHHAVGRRIVAIGPVLLALCGIMVLCLAVLPWPRLPQPDHGFLPSHVVAAVAFSGALVILTLRPMTFIVHPLVVGLGKASFSAYLMHFAVISGAEFILPAPVFARTGIPAALTGGVLFLLVLGVTGGLAQLTYRLIELPAIQLGGRVIGMSARRPLTTR